MAKYIRTYSNNSEYEAAKASADFLTPNVGYIEDTKEVKYLNSKMDLYDIYGTTDLADRQVTFKINNSYKPVTSDANKEFGLLVTDTVSNFSIYSNANYIKAFNKIGFDTSNMTNMTSMFSRCGSLVSLDLSDFNTSSVTSMYAMFYDCGNVESLNISNWDMSNVTNCNFMFDNFGTAKNTVTLTMNNTNQTTFDMIKTQLVSDNVASRVTIIRDGVNWKYQNGEWVEA